MSEPMETARELRLDACLAEVMGQRPARDLAERIAERLRAAPRPMLTAWFGSRRTSLAAAALLTLGVGAVGAVWFAQRTDPQQNAGQGPEQGQDPQPVLTDVTAERVDALVRALELPERRAEIVEELARIGAAALPRLDRALLDEATRDRADVLAALQTARHRVTQTLALQAFGLTGPVTLLADYSDNRVDMVDDQGHVVWTLEDVFGAWDAELTPAGTVLVTEFSLSRVQEVRRDGSVAWVFDDLKNPYDADRLPNGNTLIADTFGQRVIEVTPAKEIVWKCDRLIRPFDADRLANGNTLIADVQGNRVIEVSPAGEIVWQVGGMPNVHDADRLPDGNTLITLRSQGRVVEVDVDGQVVWQLDDLSSPSDADRLPNGNTVVAENTQVREFDREKKLVWRHGATWCVEVNRY
ncbi:MAG: hypothetical protein AB7O97_14745 [Planctomycetota bacterium]